MTKAEAIRTVNAFARLDGERLTTRNTCWSKMHDETVWWLSIDPRKLEQPLHLCLETANGFIWLRIPANSFRADDFPVAMSDADSRKNIQISCGGTDYMVDRNSRQSFTTYVQRRFP